MCHNEDPDLTFKVSEDTCFAARELETQDEKNAAWDGYVKPKGTTARPEPYTLSHKPIDIVMRESYYAAEYAKQHPES